MAVLLLSLSDRFNPQNNAGMLPDSAFGHQATTSRPLVMMKLGPQLCAIKGEKSAIGATSVVPEAVLLKVERWNPLCAVHRCSDLRLCRRLFLLENETRNLKLFSSTTGTVSNLAALSDGLFLAMLLLLANWMNNNLELIVGLVNV
ncbi:MAG: hypothetical protein AAGF98_14420 [Cyanobacteria bacterium P01_H01_bin.153]